jgi:hypothetical protein
MPICVILSSVRERRAALADHVTNSSAADFHQHAVAAAHGKTTDDYKRNRVTVAIKGPAVKKTERRPQNAEPVTA